MENQNAIPSGLGLELGDDTRVDINSDNVVPLFAPRMGSVAALVAAAGGPTEPRELLGERDIRATFRAVMLETPPASVHRRHKLAPFAIAAGSVAGLVAGTAGLSAAAVLPPVANHVVAQVLRQVGIDVAPTKSLSTDSAVTRSSSPREHVTGQQTGPQRTSSNSTSTSVGPVSTPKTTTPPRTHTITATVASPLCEVAVIQNHVVLLRLPTQSSVSGQLTAIPNAAPLTPPGPCSNRLITQLEKAAGKGTGSSGGTTTTPVTGTGGTGTGGTGTGGTGTGGTGTGGTGTGGTGTGGTGTGTGKGTNQGGGTGTGGGKGHHRNNGGTGTGTTPPPSTDPTGTTPPPSTDPTGTTPPPSTDPTGTTPPPSTDPTATSTTTTTTTTTTTSTNAP